MISARLAMKLCGFLYIFILVTNAASVGLGNRNDETDSTVKLPAISENPDRFRLSVIVAVISHVGIIAITGMLFLAFSSYNKLLAIIGSVSRLGEGSVLIYNEISVLKLIDVAKEYALNGANQDSLRMLGDQILQTKNTTFLIGNLLLAIGALVYCILFLQERAVSSRIAWLGLSAGILSVIGILIRLVSGHQPLSVIGLSLMIIFEIVFGVWLLAFSHKHTAEPSGSYT